ncbi:MAG: S-layer homology domain-containing protein [Firmicutes bacterium]|nr:S-layer homology domain-containing protein [Bacillota bacterium]
MDTKKRFIRAPAAAILALILFLPGFPLAGGEVKAQMSTNQMTKANFVDVQVGSWHVAALDDEGRVYTWSAGGYDTQLLGRPYDNYGIAVQVTQVWDNGSLVPMPWIRKISSSESNSVALDTDGNIWSWGIEARGPINLGHPVQSVGGVYYPAKVIMPAGIYAVDVSAACGGGRFIDQHGNLWAWGHGANALTGAGYALGTGASIQTQTPVQLTTAQDGSALPNNFVSVVASDYSNDPVSIALTSTGDVYTWAPYNAATNAANSNRPMLTVFPAGAGRIIKVDCGNGFFGAMDDNGRIYTWGDQTSSFSGQTNLGQGQTGTAGNRQSPGLITQVSTMNTTGTSTTGLIPAPVFRDFTMYQWGWMAIDRDYTIYAIGHNPYYNHHGYVNGVLVNITGDYRYLTAFRPKQVPDGAAVYTISEGWEGSAFIDTNGNAYVQSSLASFKGGATDAEPWVHVLGDQTTLFKTVAASPPENIKRYEDTPSSVTVVLSQPANEVKYVILYPDDRSPYVFENLAGNVPGGAGSGNFGIGESYYSLSFYGVEPPYYLAGSGRAILASPNGSSITSRYYANPAISQAMFNEAYNKKLAVGDAGVMTPVTATQYTVGNRFGENCAVWLQTANGAQTTRLILPFDNVYTQTQAYVRGVLNGSGKQLYAPQAVPPSQAAGGFYKSGPGYGVPLTRGRDALAYDAVIHPPPLGWDVVQPLPVTDTGLWPNAGYYTLSPPGQTFLSAAADAYGVRHRVDPAKELTLDSYAFYTDSAPNSRNTVAFTYDKNPGMWADATISFVYDDGTPIDVWNDELGAYSSADQAIHIMIPVGPALLSELDPYTPPEAEDPSDDAVGYSIGAPPDGTPGSYVTCEFPDGCNPVIHSNAPVTLYIVYREGLLNVTERYMNVAAGGVETPIANDSGQLSAVNAYEPGSAVTRPVPHIGGRIVTGYEVWTDEGGTLEHTDTVNFVWNQNADPFLAGAYAETPFAVGAPPGIGANYEIRYLYRTDANNDGVPDDLAASVTVNWYGVRADGTRAILQSRTATDMDGVTKTFLEDKANNLAAPADWNFDDADFAAYTPPGSDSPITVTLAHAAPQNVNFYYNADMNRNGIPDKDERITVKYRVYGDYTGQLLPDSVVHPYLLGTQYSGFQPYVPGYRAVGWYGGEYADTLSDEDLHLTGGLSGELSVLYDVPVNPNNPTLSIIYKKISSVTVKFTATTYAGTVVNMPDQVITELVGADVTTLVEDPFAGDPLWRPDSVNSSAPAGGVYIVQDAPRTYHLYYKENTQYSQIIKAVSSTDGLMSFENTLRFLPNYGAVTLKADQIPNYTVIGWTVYDDDGVETSEYMDGGQQDSVTIDPADGNQKIVFVYAPLDASVTIYAVDGDGDPIPEFSPIRLHAQYGSPFTCYAPYILGWNLNDNALKSIGSVEDDDSEITFAYTQALGNVTVIMKENDTNGRIIGTASMDITAANDADNPLTVTIPDLSRDYFTAIDTVPYRLVYDGNAATVEYYYAKDLRDAQTVTYDATVPSSPAVMGTPRPAGSYRVGEAALFHAPVVDNYKLVSTTPQTVIILPGAGSQDVNFDYTALAVDDLVVQAVDGAGNLLQSSVLKGVTGQNVTVRAPYAAGYRLRDGEPSVKIGTVPSVVTFYYEKDIVTVSVELKDDQNNAVAVPAGAAESYEAAMNTDFTVYAPHVPGYVLISSQSLTFPGINVSQTATFVYTPIEKVIGEYTVQITVTGKVQATGTELYGYAVNRAKNSGTFEVGALPVSGYALLSASPVTLDVRDMPITQIFLYESLATTVTIYAVDGNGAPIPNFTPILAPATINQPFSCNAPYILGWNLSGAATRTIVPDGSAGDAMTFVYTRATGGVTVLMKEDNTFGKVIRTQNYALTSANDALNPLVVPIPDLSADYYTLAASPVQTPLSFVYDGNARAAEFYYTKDLRDVDAAAYDVTYTPAGTAITGYPVSAGRYRVGEAAELNAPAVAGYRLVGQTPQTVIVGPGAAPQEARFDYASVAEDELAVEAVRRSDGAILRTYVLTGARGRGMSVPAPVIAGYALAPGESLSKAGTIPGKITFYYVKDAVTITVSLVDDENRAIAAPAGIRTSFEADRGGGFTAYAPHVPGYELCGAQSVTFANLAADGEAVFTYTPIEKVMSENMRAVTIRGVSQDTGAELYNYVVYRYKNSGGFTVDALPVYGYEPVTASATLNVQNSAIMQEFRYVSLAAAVTIRAEDAETGSELGVFTADAMRGQPFCCAAPRISGYNVVGQYALGIAAVGPEDNELTFFYEQAFGDVTVTLKENGAGGAVINVTAARLPAGVPTVVGVPDLSAAYYTALSSPETVTYDGTPVSVEYYYARQTRTVDVAAYDITGGANALLDRITLPAEYRVGEYASFGALTMTDYVLIGELTQSAYILPDTGGLGNQEVRFNYVRYSAGITPGTVTRTAMDHETNQMLFQDTTAVYTGMASVEAFDLSRMSYALMPGEEAVRVVPAGTNTLFWYVRTASAPPYADDFAPDDGNITGRGEPGASVTVTFADGGTETAVVGGDGRWSVPTRGRESGTINVTQTETGKTPTTISKSAGFGTISVTVSDASTGNPIPGAAVAINGAVYTADAGGAVGKVRLPINGSYTVTVSDGGYAGSTMSVTLSRADPVITLSVSLSKQSVSSRPGVDPFAPDDPTISGTGEPGAEIFVEFPDGSRETAAVGPDGRWSVPNRPGGGWVKITQTEPGKTGSSVTVSAGMGSLAVTVAGADRAPLQGALVTVNGVFYTTDARGAISRLRLPFGVYAVSASKQGYNTGGATAELSLTNAGASVALSLGVTGAAGAPEVPGVDNVPKAPGVHYVTGVPGGAYGPTVTHTADRPPDAEQNPQTAVPPENRVIHQFAQYLYGYPDGTVKPDGRAARAEVAAMLYRVCDDAGKTAPAPSAFTDVDPAAWYAQSVNYLASVGILVGYGDGTFRPEQPITRAEMTAIAARYTGLADAGGVFADVPEGHWAARYIGSAYALGIAAGYADGTFRPDSMITRAEAVRMIAGMLGRRSLTSALPVNIPVFADLDASHWAYADIIDASVSHASALDAFGYQIWTAVNGRPAVNSDIVIL